MALASRAREAKLAKSHIAFWEQIASRLNMRVYGFNYDYSALFMTRDYEAQIEVTPALRDHLCDLFCIPVPEPPK